jgi:precorrin-6B methylase 2
VATTIEAAAEQAITPDHIMQVGLAFSASKTLLTAVELGLFSALGEGPMTGAELAKRLGLHARAIPDFPDALVALSVLARDGDGPEARYRNTPETGLFLDRSSPAYVGGLLEMANSRLYSYWGSLTEALTTGAPQNEIKHTGESMFAKLYEDPERLEQFSRAMVGISAGNVIALAQKFDFSNYKTLCDVGGSTGQLACTVASAHPHMRCTSLDLPPVLPIARRHIAEAGLGDRVTAAAGDFLTDSLPKSDIVIMSSILHDWNLEKKKVLIRKAFEALPSGGAFIAIEAIIDDARRQNAFGLLMSLNMLIEFGDAFDFTAADFFGWCREAGFRDFKVIPLAGPASAAIAYR